MKRLARRVLIGMIGEKPAPADPAEAGRAGSAGALGPARGGTYFGPGPREGSPGRVAVPAPPPYAGAPSGPGRYAVVPPARGPFRRRRLARARTAVPLHLSSGAGRPHPSAAASVGLVAGAAAVVMVYCGLPLALALKSHVPVAAAVPLAIVLLTAVLLAVVRVLRRTTGGPAVRPAVPASRRRPAATASRPDAYDWFAAPRRRG